MLSDTIFLKDELATESFGQMLARATGDTTLEEIDLIANPMETHGGKIYLNGDLGAGKTTLARGLMRGYGYQGAVKSPTYTLVEPYEFSNGNIYHFDLYRLVDPEEVEYLGISDYFDGPNLCLVEWPENGKTVIPDPDLEILLIMKDQGRELSWWARSPRGQFIAERLVIFCRNL
jgi:tRNA threonylcarbamoyladenosine biosynthesis protein TsaE